MPSVIISVCTPRSRTPLSSSSVQTALGMPPMPICRQAPSSISAAISRATARSIFGRRRIRQFGRRCVVALDDVVDLADVDAVVVAVDIGQAAARLDDDHPGALDDRAVPEIGGAQIEIAVFVDRAGLEDDDVDRVDEAPIVVRDLAKIDRHVVAASGIVLLPVVAGEVQLNQKK